MVPGTPCRMAGGTGRVWLSRLGFPRANQGQRGCQLDHPLSWHHQGTGCYFYHDLSRWKWQSQWGKTKIQLVTAAFTADKVRPTCGYEYRWPPLVEQQGDHSRNSHDRRGQAGDRVHALTR
jgi:hypothetical protein